MICSRQALACMLLAVCASPAFAQDARLRERFDGVTASLIASLADSARLQGLPAESLIQRALEGASKGAPADRIVEVVRALKLRLMTARSALGESSSEADLVAGATALQVGVTTAQLARLRAARPHGSLATELVILADLVHNGVPGDSATQVLRELVRAAATGTELLSYQRLVRADIAAGAHPAAAAATRADALIGGRRIRTTSTERLRSDDAS